MVDKSYKLMGVVNVTPDSFSDGGQFLDTDKAVKHAIKLVEEGVDILDIGGESTRPGANTVSPEEEQNRVLPVIKSIRAQGIKTPISIDTRNSETMMRSIECGANIINDISALRHDPQSINVISDLQVPVMLMHMQGTPETMQKNPTYGDVVADVMAFFEERLETCTKAGIKKENITLDVGIGFGKSLDDNLKLLSNLSKFHDLGCDLLLGTSRKSFIEKICPNTPADQRLAGSIASAIKGLDQGVQLFRVHDIKETKQAFEVWKKIY